MTAAFNAWARRVGLIGSPHQRQIRGVGGGYVVFLGRTRDEVECKVREYRRRGLLWYAAK